MIVESFLEGDDHRLLVVNGELVAATRRTPGHVVGDGEHTIVQLIEIVNQDPRRGVGHEKVLTRLGLDAQAEKMLERAGLTAQSVPERGRVVYLDRRRIFHRRHRHRRDGRHSSRQPRHGSARDSRDRPRRRRCRFPVDEHRRELSHDRRRHLRSQCGPGFRMHVAPSEGTARDVAAPVIDMLFPPGAPSRVPIAAVTGTNGKTTTARMLAHITKMGGYTPGLTTTDGVYIDGQRTVQGDMTGPMSAQMVLADPQIDMAVLETARVAAAARRHGRAPR